ncbi:MAG: TonB-dependent receptor [Pseudomonadota bacterium]
MLHLDFLLKKYKKLSATAVKNTWGYQTMNKKMKPLASALSFALLASTTNLSMSGQVWAEETEAEEEIESISVTGSRIRRQNYESPTPITVLDEAQIQNAGFVTVGEILNELPQLNNTFSLANSGRFIGTAGGGFLDLRGLGTERTLVLINGRRHVAGSDGTSVVDVNSISSAMIKRVEVLTGANSAVYGGDAVTGVVNFVLKDDFNGTRVNTYTGTADDSGFDRKGINITSGFDFAEDKGNAIVSLSFDSQDPLFAGERGGDFTAGWGLFDNPADGDTIDPETNFQIDDGIPDQIYVRNSGFWFLSEAGTFLGLESRLDNQGNLIPIDFDSIEYYNGGLDCAGVNCPALDLRSFVNLQTQFERYTLDANFNYNLSDNHSWFLESRYASVEGNQQGQSSFDTNPPITIFADNAYISPSLASAFASTGASSLGLYRFNTDLGFRQEEDTRDTFRLVSGFKGLFLDNWDYEAFINYGTTKITRVNYNNRIDERFAAATDAVALTAEDVANINSSATGSLIREASVGQIVCRSTLQAATGSTPLLPDGSPAPGFAYDGCLPLNVLGYGVADPTAVDWINSTAIARARVEQTQLAGFVSNPQIFDTWAGSAAVVAGFEYREERSSSNEDSLSALGNTFFNALAETKGRFDVSEFYAETAIPLATNLPGIQSLNVELAARYSDYSTIGDTTTWEVRLQWAINEELSVRSTIGEAFRAPNITDLFSPAGENFSLVEDPCDFENIDQGSNGQAIRIANCQALGIADPTTFNSQDESSVNVLSGGNPNLEEETAKTTTVGVVYSPSWFSGFNIAIDYWDIQIENAIDLTTTQQILDRCVDDPNGIDNEFCALVTRDNVGNIALINSFALNLNELETSGIDFELDYTYNTDGFGSFRTRLFGSYMEERIFVLNSADNVDDVKGELGNPELQFSLNLNWDYNNIEVFIESRFIDEMYLEEQETLFGSATNNDPNPDIADITSVDSTWILDVGAYYNFDFGLRVGALIDNVTSEEPPFMFTGSGEGSAIYPNVGTFYSVRAAYEF